MNAGRALRAIALGIGIGIGFAGAACALDANTATQAELETIRGVGPALSARIVEARRARPFTDLDDLKARVRGIGDANLRHMREAGLAVGPSARVQTFTGRPAAAARAKREPGRRSGSPEAARR